MNDARHSMLGGPPPPHTHLHGLHNRLSVAGAGLGGLGMGAGNMGAGGERSIAHTKQAHAQHTHSKTHLLTHTLTNTLTHTTHTHLHAHRDASHGHARTIHTLFLFFPFLFLTHAHTCIHTEMRHLGMQGHNGGLLGGSAGGGLGMMGAGACLFWSDMSISVCSVLSLSV